MMKMAAIAAALALGASTLALAQTATPVPSEKPTTGAEGAGSVAAPTAGPGTVGTSEKPAVGTAGGGSVGAETAGSGTSNAPVRMTPADVKEALERQGYSDVTDVDETLDGFTARAMKGGKEMQLKVDRSGRAMPKEE